MRTLFLKWMVCITLPLILSCSDGKQLPQITVDFTWPQEMKSCFDPVNPVIRLGNLPDGVSRLSVSVFDTQYSVNHGGGECDYANDGIIPAGSLADYQGPCEELALSGPGYYEFTVKALDAEGNLIAQGKGGRSYPELE